MSKSSQALIVAGGVSGSGSQNFLSTVLTLDLGAAMWKERRPLPNGLKLLSARASIADGRLRVTGGWSEDSTRREVD